MFAHVRRRLRHFLDARASVKKLRVPERLRIRDENSVDIIFQLRHMIIRFTRARARENARLRRHAPSCDLYLLAHSIELTRPKHARSAKFGGTCTNTPTGASLHTRSLLHARIRY